jgi:hypothetical protein
MWFQGVGQAAGAPGPTALRSRHEHGRPPAFESTTAGLVLDREVTTPEAGVTGAYRQKWRALVAILRYNKEFSHIEERLWLSWPVRIWATIDSSRHSAPAEWAKCGARPTRG